MADEKIIRIKLDYENEGQLAALETFLGYLNSLKEKGLIEEGEKKTESEVIIVIKGSEERLGSIMKMAEKNGLGG